MVHRDDLRTQLLHATDKIIPTSPPMTSAQIELLQETSRRRHHWLSGALGIVVAVAIAIAAVALSQTAARHVDQRKVNRNSASVPELRALRWKTLPSAPIRARDDAAFGWAGNQFIVWGGRSGPAIFGDGAAYSPNTRSWSLLPAAPLTRRYATASVMTDEGLFVWGGLGQAHNSALHDGAIYSSSSRRWKSLPEVSDVDYACFGVASTGEQVYLFLVPRLQPAQINEYVYSLQSDAWKSIGPVVTDGSVSSISAIYSSSKGLLWAEVRGGHQSSGLRTAAFGFNGDSTLKRLSARYLPFDNSRFVGRPAEVRGGVFLAPENFLCDRCTGQPPIGLRSTLVRYQRKRLLVRHGQLDDLSPSFLSTGGTGILAYDTQAEFQTAGLKIPRGGCAFWSLADNSWIRLDTARYVTAGNDAVVWTGNAVLIWGLLQGRDHQRTSVTGIELSR